MKLPVVSGKKLVKALSRLGYEQDHITGSHIILRLDRAPFTRVTVPNHPEISKGTLLSIMRHVGMTRDNLIKLLKE